LAAEINQYFRPATLDDALAALASGPWRVLAGGTDIYASKAGPAGQPLLDIGAVSQLRGISKIADGWRINALATWAELIATPLPRWFEALKGAAREVGGVQIQNVASIAGNVCNASPAADGTVALLALDARIILQSAAGAREIALADFVTGPRRIARRADELVVAIDIPQRSGSARSTFTKLGSRRYLVISTAIVSIVIDVNESNIITCAALAVGALSPKAERLWALEGELCGLKRRPDIARLVEPRHLAGLAPIDDVRASKAYRLDAVTSMLKRDLERIAA
jgi:CO/xanthine dehydrogenase FAD-binding subunit